MRSCTLGHRRLVCVHIDKQLCHLFEFYARVKKTLALFVCFLEPRTREGEPALNQEHIKQLYLCTVLFSHRDQAGKIARRLYTSSRSIWGFIDDARSFPREKDLVSSMQQPSLRARTSTTLDLTRSLLFRSQRGWNGQFSLTSCLLRCLRCFARKPLLC